MSFATLDGHRVTRALVRIPAAGEWFADVEIDTEETLSGQLTLTVGDLDLVGTVSRGGLWAGSSAYRIVAGAAGWGTEAGARGYGGAVYRSTIIADLALATGETVASGYEDAFLGEAYARPSGTARRVLSALVGEQGWYVSTAGVTTIAARASTAIGSEYQVTRVLPGSAVAIVATEEPAAFQPGATMLVGGSARTIASVELELTASQFRVYATLDDDGDRLKRAIRALIRDAMIEVRHHGVWEYRVFGSSGNRWDLQIVESASGLPDLQGVPLRPGLPGGNADLTIGSVVLVGFVNGNPARPVVLAYEDPDGDGWAPPTVEIDATSIELGDAVARALRSGSVVDITGVQAGAGISGATITLNAAFSIPPLASKVTL